MSRDILLRRLGADTFFVSAFSPTVTGQLGVGSLVGVVYKAEDTRLHRLVALKLLPEGVAKDPQSLARFEPEAHSESLIPRRRSLYLKDSEPRRLR
jgi:serine/threonine protein kinase